MTLRKNFYEDKFFPLWRIELIFCLPSKFSKMKSM